MKKEIIEVNTFNEETVEDTSVNTNKSFKSTAKKVANAVIPFVGVALAVAATAVLTKRVVTPREQKED